MDDKKPRARRRKRISGAPDPFRVAVDADAPSSRRSSNPGAPPSSRKAARGARSSVPGAPPSGRGAIKPYVPGAPLVVPKPAPLKPSAPAETEAATPVATEALSAGKGAPSSVDEKRVVASPWTLPRVIGVGGGFALAVGGLIWFASTSGGPGDASPRPTPVVDVSQNSAPAPPTEPQAAALAEPKPAVEAQAAPSDAKSPEAQAKASPSSAPSAAADAKGKASKGTKSAAAKPDPKATVKATAPTAAPTLVPTADPSKPAFTFQFQ